MARFTYHLSTPPGEAAIAVIELHGEEAPVAISSIFRSRTRGIPSAGGASLGELTDTAGATVDEAVLTHIPPGCGWSGLETWALSVHGGVWIQSRVSEVLRRLGGTEISRREVLAAAVREGRMDSPRAAAFELLVEARTEKAARFFVRQYRGELSERLSRALGLCDEGDLDSVRAIVEPLVEGARRALRLSAPLRVLLAGRPNAGKSTLFNRLLEEERAVVSPWAGTTRDLVEATTAFRGYPVELTDSAGIRRPEEVGPVEAEGIRRALRRSYDALAYLIPPPWTRLPEDEAFLEGTDPDRRLVIATFADLAAAGESPGADLRISSLTGEGLDRLRGMIVERWIDDRPDSAADVPCAAFIPGLRDALAGVLGACERGDLDAVRTGLVESARGGWPAPDGL